MKTETAYLRDLRPTKIVMTSKRGVVTTWANPGPVAKVVERFGHVRLEWRDEYGYCSLAPFGTVASFVVEVE